MLRNVWILFIIRSSARNWERFWCAASSTQMWSMPRRRNAWWISYSCITRRIIPPNWSCWRSSHMSPIVLSTWILSMNYRICRLNKWQKKMQKKRVKEKVAGTASNQAMCSVILCLSMVLLFRCGGQMSSLIHHRRRCDSFHTST